MWKPTPAEFDSFVLLPPNINQSINGLKTDLSGKKKGLKKYFCLSTNPLIYYFKGGLSFPFLPLKK